MNNIKELYLKYKEIINYLIFGVLTTVVSLATYYICVYTFLNPDNSLQLQVANIVSWIAGVTFAYITNRKFVFESEAGKFVTSRIATLLTDMLIMFIGVTILKLNDKIIKLISQIIVIIANYLLSKMLVFRKIEN